MEGGGFRGVYTAGVLDFFMEKQAMFASIYGISAGACNALSYLSQDKGRYVAIAKRFCNDPRYVGMRQLRLVWFFDIALILGQHHYLLVPAILISSADRNRVGDAAVQIPLSADHLHRGEQRH